MSGDSRAPEEAEDASREETKPRKARKASSSLRGSNGVRYFLAANDTGNHPSVLLGEEFSSEDEVLVASFQKGLAFYRVETWKARAEKRGRNMVLRKQS